MAVLWETDEKFAVLSLDLTALYYYINKIHLEGLLDLYCTKYIN